MKTLILTFWPKTFPGFPTCIRNFEHTFFQEILIHSFLLDADADTCQLPFICPRKTVRRQFGFYSINYFTQQAMFHPPGSLNENVQQFLSLAEAQKILSDLNKILRKTSFSPKPSNPCLLLAFLASFGVAGLFTVFMATHEWKDSRNLGLYIQLSIFCFVVIMMLPFTCFLVLLCVSKSSRRKRMIGYVANWNRCNLLS